MSASSPTKAESGMPTVLPASGLSKSNAHPYTLSFADFVLAMKFALSLERSKPPTRFFAATFFLPAAFILARFFLCSSAYRLRSAALAAAPVP